MLHSLIQAGFLVRVRPSQSAELAFVGDQVEVAFTNHGPPHSGGQYVGNISTASGMSIGPVASACTEGPDSDLPVAVALTASTNYSYRLW